MWLIGRGHQFAVLMTGVRKLQRQLCHATEAADERVSVLQVKVEELEAQNLSRALAIRQLEQENQDLHRVVETKDQDLAEAQSSCNDVQKKLAKAHEVIEDLLGRPKVRGLWLPADRPLILMSCEVFVSSDQEPSPS